MLLRERYINDVVNRLSWISTTVNLRNSLNLYDIDIHSESLFCELLNLVFGYHLENLNYAQKNYTSIDLGDRENRIAVQVTAQNTRTKIQETLDKFISNGYENEYDRLIVLIIGTKPKFKKPFITNCEFCFNITTDVWDITYLIDAISKKTDEQLSDIYEFFRGKLYPNEGYIGLKFNKLGKKMQAEAYSICKAKLLSIGINAETADRIIEADINSAKYQYIFDAVTGGKRYLIGEFGSGKSHALLIVSQQLMNEYLSGNSTVLPLYVQGKEIARIGSIKQWLNDLNYDETNYFLFMDGFDEIDFNFARQLVEEINILSIQRPQSKILVASRPLTILSIETEKTFYIHPLSSRECESLYNIISCDDGGERAFRWISDHMRKVLAKPFFCIIFALFKSEPRGWAKQDIDLIIALVSKSMQRAGQYAGSVSVDLSKIAAKAVDRNFADVHISEIQFSSSIENILATGFITFSNDYVSFPLPIIAQWMAAEAIRHQVVKIDDIILNRSRLEKWIYVLSILFSQMSFEESLEYFSKIVYTAPGVASRIIRDGIRFDKLESLPPAYECGERLQQTMRIWIDALGPLAQWIAPLKCGELRPLGIEATADRITYSWLRIESGVPVHVLSYSEMRQNASSIHSRGIPAQATWPWIVTFEYLSDYLKKAIEGHVIIANEGQLQEEYLWNNLLRISGKGSLYEKELDLTKFEKYREFVGRRWIVNGKTVDADFLFYLIDNHIENGRTSIVAPYPVSDKQHTPGWVWSSYSPERFLEKVQFVYGTAFSEYMQMAETVFIKLKEDLRTAKLAPCELVGGLEFNENSNSFEDSPALTWYMKALPINARNGVDIQFRKIEFNDDELFHSLIRHNLKMRPGIENRDVVHITSQFVDICNSTPVTNIVFSWIEDELKKIGWIKGI